MSDSDSKRLEDLIAAPEPSFVAKLHGLKVMLAICSLVLTALVPIGLIIGVPENGWISLTLLAGAWIITTVVALVANEMSQRHFASKAAKLGIERTQARRFWQNHDWE